MTNKLIQNYMQSGCYIKKVKDSEELDKSSISIEKIQRQLRTQMLKIRAASSSVSVRHCLVQALL
jgi:hypothetical protein